MRRQGEPEERHVIARDDVRDLRIGHDGQGPETRAHGETPLVDLLVPRDRVHGRDERHRARDAGEPLSLDLDPGSARGGRRGGPLNPSAPVPLVPVRVEFPKRAGLDSPGIARNLDHPIRAKAVDAVTGRCGSVNVDEDPDRVHGPWRRAASHQGGSRDLHEEGNGPEVRYDAETDDVHVRIQHTTGRHRFRSNALPITEIPYYLSM